MIRRIVLTVGLVSLLLFIMINFVYAQESGPQSINAPQSVMGTAFTYQGQLKDNGSPANGTFDFLFRLYITENGGSPLGNLAESPDVTVTNGYFATQIDFGADAFNGEARWLGIWVRPGASTGAYTALTPRQSLTPAPYALALPGLYTQQNITSPNVIGGYSGNVVANGVHGAAIGGGGEFEMGNAVGADYGTVGGGVSNDIDGWLGTVGGGFNNTASGQGAIVGGGFDNMASGDYAVIGGGEQNHASWDHATVSGGEQNSASSFNATVGGGAHNSANHYYTTVSGGEQNSAASFHATVPGGYGNSARGRYSFAAGNQARAVHEGTFVWADATNAPISSTMNNQFIVRANGGVGINTTDTLTNGLTVNGRVIAGGTATGVAGGEPFVARGSNAGLSLDDRAGGANPRWVIFPNSGALNFWNGTDRMSVSGAGVLTIGALGSAGSTALCRNASNQIATCSSSARYKNNISALDLGLETVVQLHPVTFDWTGTGEHDLGFVAEEVDDVTSLLTTRNAEGQIEGVKYDRVSAVLVKAVQEQQQQIAALQQQNIELQTRLANLDPATSTTSFNLFNLLSVVACGGMIFLVIKQLQSKRGEA